MNGSVLFLLAQSQLADPQAVSGGAVAGWTSAGMLMAVLGWLMLKHLPDKDKQVKDLIDAGRAVEKELRAENATERENCDKRIEAVNAKQDGLAEFMRVRAEAAAKRKGTIR